MYSLINAVAYILFVYVLIYIPTFKILFLLKYALPELKKLEYQHLKVNKKAYTKVYLSLAVYGLFMLCGIALFIYSSNEMKIVQLVAAVVFVIVAIYKIRNSYKNISEFYDSYGEFIADNTDNQIVDQTDDKELRPTPNKYKTYFYTLLVLCSILILISSLLIVQNNNNTKQYNAKVSKYERQNEKLTKLSSSLTSDNEQLTNKLNDSEEKVRRYKEKINLSHDKIYEANWYAHNVAVVTLHGECYHKPSCSYIGDGSLYVDTIENLKSAGYRPCSYCEQ